MMLGSTTDTMRLPSRPSLRLRLKSPCEGKRHRLAGHGVQVGPELVIDNAALEPGGIQEAEDLGQVDPRALAGRNVAVLRHPGRDAIEGDLVKVGRGGLVLRVAAVLVGDAHDGLNNIDLVPLWVALDPELVVRLELFEEAVLAGSALAAHDH